MVIRQTQTGFSVLKLEFTIMVVVLIGLGAWVIYNSHHKNVNQTVVSASTTSSKAAHPATTTPSPTSASGTPSEAVSLVQSAYTAALNYHQTNSAVAQGEIDSMKADLSSDLYTKLSTDSQSGENNVIFCAQALPSSVTAVDGTNTPTTATVIVNEVIGASTEQVTTTVDLTSMKLTTITCSD
jgi:hypothetical protein